ncbi:Dynein light chain LC6 flagellar outer arm [Taenia solium]|eukprot:TsM_000172700 transcript=TsM_000172700 gene=TsM_000172700
MYKQQEKLEVRSTKMPRDMERDALETARRALEKNSEPRAVANMIKKEFDQRYTPNWHCIVGNHFGR